MPVDALSEACLGTAGAAETRSSAHLQSISERLLAWYDVHARRLPWRALPGTLAPDPYAVWLSEVMLQQTTVAAVKPYHGRFLARWPTVAALAAADESELMAAWAGLGYYARARNLLACARAIVAEHGGVFPRTEPELRRLPGLGAYTAAAVAAIAFGEPIAAVDGNVERVVARLFAVATPLPGARPQLRVLAQSLVPAKRPGDFAQAMMDLGATICVARRPACAICPLREGCTAVRTADPAAFPVKPPKAARPTRRGTAFVLEQGGAVLLVRRPPRGLLGGMRALPTGPWQENDPGLAGAPAQAVWRPLGTVTHVFTHFALNLAVVAGVADERGAEGEWWPLDAIGTAGLPTLFKRAASLRRAEAGTGAG